MSECDHSFASLTRDNSILTLTEFMDDCNVRLCLDSLICSILFCSCWQNATEIQIHKVIIRISKVRMNPILLLQFPINSFLHLIDFWMLMRFSGSHSEICIWVVGWPDILYRLIRGGGWASSFNCLCQLITIHDNPGNSHFQASSHVTFCPKKIIPKNNSCFQSYLSNK